MLSRVMIEKPEVSGRVLWPGQVGDFNVIHVVDDIYELRYLQEPVVMTGANVTTVMRLPRPHRLLAAFFEHTTAAGAENNNANAVRFDYEEGSRWKQIYTDAAAVWADASLDIEKELGPTRYRLQCNTTNTHLIYVSLKVEARA